MSDASFDQWEDAIARLVAGEQPDPRDDADLQANVAYLRTALRPVPMEDNARSALKERLLAAWAPLSMATTRPTVPARLPVRRVVWQRTPVLARVLLAAACLAVAAGLTYNAISTPAGTNKPARPIAIGAGATPSATSLLATVTALPSATRTSAAVAVLPRSTRPPAAIAPTTAPATAPPVPPTAIATVVAPSPTGTAVPTESPVPTVAPTAPVVATARATMVSAPPASTATTAAPQPPAASATAPAPPSATAPALLPTSARPTALPRRPATATPVVAVLPSATPPVLPSATPPAPPSHTATVGTIAARDATSTQVPATVTSTSPPATARPSATVPPTAPVTPSATPTMAPVATAPVQPTIRTTVPSSLPSATSTSPVATQTPSAAPTVRVRPTPTASATPTERPMAVNTRLPDVTPTGAPPTVGLTPPTPSPTPSGTAVATATATPVDTPLMVQALVSPTPHLVAVRHTLGGTPTATALPFVLVPYPLPLNAVMGSPLSLARPMPVGADVLLSLTLPLTMPTTASVANVSPPVVGAGVALNLAAALGPSFSAAATATLTNPASTAGPFGVVGPWSGGTYRLRVGSDQSSFSVSLTMVRPGTSPFVANDSLANADASTRALALLGLLRLARDNLIPHDIAVTSQGELESATFGQTIGGVEVLGHTTALVTFDASGRLVALHYASIVTSGARAYPLRGLVQAISDLQQGSGFYSSLANVEAGTPLEVQGISLAYIALSSAAGADTTYLEPVYVFTGTIRTADGAPPFTAYVPALDPRAYAH